MPIYFVSDLLDDVGTRVFPEGDAARPIMAFLGARADITSRTVKDGETERTSITPSKALGLVIKMSARLKLGGDT